MASRAQGAMEYLMSYGWAILVVMVVGVALWNTGIIDLGGSAPATSSGFEVLKPLLPTCQITQDIYPQTTFDYDGFSCQIINSGGTDILITNLLLLVNEQYCQFMIAAVPTYESNDAFIYLECQQIGQSVSCNPPTCIGSVSLCVDGNKLVISKDTQFSLDILSRNTDGFGPCRDVIDGEHYSVSVDIEYEVDIGGIISTKHDTGTIRLKGT